MQAPEIILSMSQESYNMSDELVKSLHQYEALCAKIENLPQSGASDYLAELTGLKAEYAKLAPLPDEYAEILNKRYAHAVVVAENAQKEVEQRRRREEALLQDAAECLDEIKKYAAMPQLSKYAGAVETLDKRWQNIVSHLGAAPEFAGEFTQNIELARQKIEAEKSSDSEKTAIVEKFISELEALVNGDNIDALKAKKTQIENEYRVLTDIPAAVADRFSKIHHQSAVKLAQHYETMDLARWESYTLKLDICSRLDKMLLQDAPNYPQLAKELNTIRERWKTLGAVPKEKFDEINPRYLELTRKLQQKIDEYFANLRTSQKQAAAQKLELCRLAEEVAALTNWNEGSEKFRQLQTEWKNIPNAGSQEKNLYAAFRAAADRFFQARNAYFEERNQYFKEIVERKRELIANAAKLFEIPPEVAVRQARMLRNDYQALPFAGKAEAELAGAFNGILDKFFQAKREAVAGKEAAARQLIEELAVLAQDFTGVPEAARRYREIKAQLRELNCHHLTELEDKASQAFERRLAEEKRKFNADKLAIYKNHAETVARHYEQFLQDRSLDLSEISNLDLSMFAGLDSAVKLLCANDDKCCRKLERHLEENRKNAKRICEELEKIIGGGAKNETGSADALAAELAAAIAGNFAVGPVAVKRVKVDPNDLIEEYFRIGILPLEDLQSSLLIIEKAKVTAK